MALEGHLFTRYAAVIIALPQKVLANPELNNMLFALLSNDMFILSSTPFC